MDPLTDEQVGFAPPAAGTAVPTKLLSDAEVGFLSDQEVGFPAPAPLSGAPAKAAYGLDAAIARNMAGTATAAERLLDPGPLPPPTDYMRHVRNVETAGLHPEWTGADAVPEHQADEANFVEQLFHGVQPQPEGTVGPEEKGQGTRAAQREQIRRAAIGPLPDVVSNAQGAADEYSRAEEQTPGPAIAGKAGEFVGGVLPFLAEAAIPGVGPAVAAAHGALSSGGETWQQAYGFYRAQGLKEDAARAKADDLAGKVGVATGLIFSNLPGAPAEAAKTIGARVLDSLGAGAHAGGLMAADTAQRLVQEKQTIRPELSFGDAAQEIMGSYLAGQGLGSAMHLATAPRAGIDDMPLGQVNARLAAVEKEHGPRAGREPTGEEEDLIERKQQLEAVQPGLTTIGQVIGSKLDSLEARLAAAEAQQRAAGQRMPGRDAADEARAANAEITPPSSQPPPVPAAPEPSQGAEIPGKEALAPVLAAAAPPEARGPALPADPVMVARLRSEGVPRGDADALASGAKTPNDVVDALLPGLVRPGPDQGHDEAYMEAREQALARLQAILAGRDPEAPAAAPGAGQAAEPSENVPGGEAGIPAEEGTAPPAKVAGGGARKQFWIHARADGVFDILDAIQDLGGVRPPKTPEDMATGNYDGWSEAMTGQARLLINRAAAHRPDTLMQELRDTGWPRIQEIHDLYDAISGAVAEREALRATGGGRQAQEERLAAVMARPANESGGSMVSVDDFHVGDKFRLLGKGVSAFEVEVMDRDPATGEVRLEGGRGIGRQTLPQGAELWARRSSLPDHVRQAAEAREAQRKAQGGHLGEQPPGAPAYKVGNPELVNFQHGGQKDMVIRAQDPQGNYAGHISYSEHQGEPAINWIQVEPAMRRQGIGRALVQRMQDEYPGRRIAWGLTTEEGERLRQGFGQDLRLGEPGMPQQAQLGLDLGRPGVVVSGHEAQPTNPSQGGPQPELFRLPQGELALPGGPRTAAVPGRPSGPEPVNGPGPAPVGEPAHGAGEHSAEALRTLGAAELQAGLSGSPTGKISSIDPERAPHGIPTFDIRGQVIRTPEDFARTLLAIRSPYQETLKIAILDKNKQVVHSQVLTAGTVSWSWIDARDLLRLVEKWGHLGRDVILSHNHPGGDPRPSPEDAQATRQITEFAKQAGFRVVDHVITDGDRYYSFSDQQVHSLSGAVLAPWEKIARSDLRMVDSGERWNALVNGLRQGNQDVGHIVYLTTRNTASAIERVSQPNAYKLWQALTRGLGIEGARNVLVDFGPGMDENEASETAYEFNRRLRDATNARVIDAAGARGRSLRDAGYQFKEGSPKYRANQFELPGAEQAFNLAGEKGIDWEKRAQEKAKAEAGSKAAVEKQDREQGTLFKGGEEPLALHEPGEDYGKRKAYEDVVDRLKAISDRVGGLGDTPEERSERYQLSRESLDLQRRLVNDPEYVADLYRQMETATGDLARNRAAGQGLGVGHAGDVWRDLSERLEAVPDTLRARVYNELLARGEIMGPSNGPVASRHSLGGLTAWLSARKLDSPALGIRERLNLAGRLADTWDKYRSGAAKALDTLRAGWEAFKAQYQSPPADTEFRKLVKDWLQEKQWTGLETHRWVTEMRRQVQSPLRRQALSIWLEAGGNEGVLRAQAADVPEQYRKVWQTALTLRPEERALALRIKADFESKLEDALNLGLVKKGRQDYGVPQLWRVLPKSDEPYDPTAPRQRQGSARNPSAQLDPRDPFFALQRKSPTYFDGIMNGGIPQDLDAANLVARYNSDFHNALADRGMIKALRDVKAKDGQPGIMLAGRVQIEPREGGQRAYFVDNNWRSKEAQTAEGEPYRTVDHWALRDWHFASRDAEGNPILVRGDFLVHPEFEPFLKNELVRSGLREAPGIGAVMKSAAFLKSSKFASATFHMATLAEHSWFHAFAGKPSAERLGLLWPSTKGVDLNPEHNADLAALMRGGMDLGFGGERQIFEEGVASHGGILAHVPGLGDALSRLTDWLFKDYMPKLKVKTGQVILDSNRARYGSKLSDEQIAELTARQVNAAFGGQNWRLMGTNKTWMDVNRLLLNAPDFLLSRTKVVAQALKPYNAEQRYFLLAQAALVYTGARVLNYLFNGDPKWDPALADSVVFRGRAYKARFLVSDMKSAVADPLGFAAGRLGPFVRAGIEGATGRDMRTSARIEVPLETRIKAIRSAEVVLKSLAQWLIPIGAEGFLPGAAGREQTGPGQAAMGLLGVSGRRYTPETEMYEAARSWLQNNTDPKIQRRVAMREAQPTGPGPYRKLDALLDGDDVGGAERELRAMLQDGFSMQGLERRYQSTQRPFTGSKATEEDFMASLSPAQQQTYQKALDLREMRAQRFAALPSTLPIGNARASIGP